MGHRTEKKRRFLVFILYFMVIAIGVITGVSSGYVYKAFSKSSLYPQPLSVEGGTTLLGQPGAPGSEETTTTANQQAASAESGLITIDKIYGLFQEISDAWKQYVEDSVAVEAARESREAATQSSLPQ
ncbi:MAG: hypothetical protein COS99_01505 [Candidatus Omnitrophica bacterium CG07_land_8_20_14_0_80_42_15]|uniref:Uncharacterized protein n=1 Tax=Candidatus Aquitaenariimonas noxiae TaxID=1974741 RepID=A0A2J0L4H1_9BACT|nr:MAG: hypothetical protein COS99_01505 [Candidatus Omnitrophica bacterium CG07_land_8_20_14_0_80_42_15]